MLDSEGDLYVIICVVASWKQDVHVWNEYFRMNLNCA
jgi:hypothetical protein